MQLYSQKKLRKTQNYYNSAIHIQYMLYCIFKVSENGLKCEAIRKFKHFENTSYKDLNKCN